MNSTSQPRESLNNYSLLFRMLGRIHYMVIRMVQSLVARALVLWLEILQTAWMCDPSISAMAAA